jgi:CDP-6-deoxy-D-xylo-4-hexulose-3-dehydrase
LENNKIQTRNLFAGNLLKHPAFNSMRLSKEGFRISGGLENTDFIMENTFWTGVYPGMTEEKISWTIDCIREFCKKNYKK